MLNAKVQEGKNMKKRFFPLAIFLVIAMFIISGHINNKEFIFPEISALAVGAWVMKQSPWKTSMFKLWFSPSLAALTGFFIIKMFSYSPFLMITGAFCLVIIQLKLARSCVLPSISAAILPIITRADSWAYPLSVGVLTGIIAVGRILIINTPAKESRSDLSETSQELSGEFLHWGKIFLGISAITLIALQFNMLYIIAPPLIVTFVELSNPNSKLRQRLGEIFTLLAFAATGGVLSLYFVHYVWQWPIWVSSALAFLGLVVLYIALKLAFPPAAAICLLPTLLPEVRLLDYIWQVLLGTVIFMLIDVFCFKRKAVTVQNENIIEVEGNKLIKQSIE